MSRLHQHTERHAISKIGWLRAAVLGANDGIVSTASLIIGVGASGADRSAILVAGTAGLIAGAMSMAAGEYVSVSSQSDTEKADLARETAELKSQPEQERKELTDIYVARGLEKPLAREVAEKLMALDAIGTHARDELHITTMTAAKPLQAAMVSATTFAAGAVAPLIVVLLAPLNLLVVTVSLTSIVYLALLGGIGARTGGAPMTRAIARVVFWGAFAMGISALVGLLFGAAV